MNWRPLFGSRLLIAVLAILVIAAIYVSFHDPFDFDDRPQIERLMRLALSNAKADTTVDMEERMWSQVKLGEAGDLSSMSAREWEAMSNSFLAHNRGYIGLQLLDSAYHKKRTAALPEAAGLDATLDFLADARLQHTLQTAATATSRVAAVPISLPNRKPGYLIAVPDLAHHELVGFLVVESDVEKTLDSMLSEFKELGYSVAVSDNFRQLYQTPGSGNSEERKQWGQSAKVPLPAVDWSVEVWPRPESVAEARSALPELGALTALLLLLLLGATAYFAHKLRGTSADLRRAHDELEGRVFERTAQLEKANEALLHVQDQERRRIARELHDSTVQIMGALAIDIEKIQQLVPAGDSTKARKLLADSSELVERATTELRTISYLLHPPILDDLGLEGVVPWYAAGFSSRSGIQVSVDVRPELGRFPHELELTLFRIVQEALTNVHRHSGSPTAEITVFRDALQVTLQITDHGRGIPPGVLEPARGARAVVGVGIAGMQERVRQLGGRLEIESADKGTSIRTILPISGATPVSEHDNSRRDTHVGKASSAGPTSSS